MMSLSPITALVGRNGAGKTTVLRAIRELSRLASPRRKLRDAPEELELGEHRHPAIKRQYVRIGETAVGLSASGPGTNPNGGSEMGQWGFYFDGDTKTLIGDDHVPVDPKWCWTKAEREEGRAWSPEVGPATVVDEQARKNMFDSMRSLLADSDAIPKDPGNFASPVSTPKAEWVDELVDCQYLHGIGVDINRPSYTSDIPPRLTPSGDNLPSVIAYLMTSEPERFAELSAAFRELIPFVDGIRVRPAKVRKIESRLVTVNRKEVAYPDEREYSGHELLLDLKSGKGVAAEVVSEGTLLILALLTIFHSSDAPRLVLIDDVEQALHPWAQRVLVSHFKQLQKRRPNLQMILTTHSPYIIDELEPSEVWMLAEGTDGCSVTKRFDQHPDLAKARDVLTTGEFWSSEGEDWIISR